MLKDLFVDNVLESLWDNEPKDIHILDDPIIEPFFKLGSCDLLVEDIFDISLQKQEEIF